MSNTPKLRFKEFSGDWESKQLYKVVERVTRKNKGTQSTLALTISARYGLVDQKIFFNKLVASKNLEEYYLLKNGEFAYNKSYSNGYPWGAIKRLDRYDKGVLSSLYICFRNLRKINSDYIKQYFETSKWHKEVSMIAVEGARNHGLLNISVSDFFNTLHYIPSLKEQEKISSFFSLIDKKISLQGEKVEALKDYKKGIMQKIFSRELRFKDDNGKDYPEWEERRFKNFVKINQGLQIPISERYTSDGENRYFYITNEFLKSNSRIKYYIETPPKNVICEEDDILMTRTGNTGKVVTGVSGAFHNNFFKIDYDRYKCNKMFLYYILTSHKIQKNIIRLAGTSTIPDLNHSDFYNIKIKLPIKEEQEKIANFLSNIDLKIEKEQYKLNSLNEYKKGLLQQMFV